MVKKKRLLKRDLLLFGETLALFRPSLGILERLDLVVQKAEISDRLLRLTIHKKISDSHQVAKVIFGIVKKEVVQIDIIAVERQDFGIFAKGQKVEGRQIHC